MHTWVTHLIFVSQLLPSGYKQKTMPSYCHSVYKKLWEFLGSAFPCREFRSGPTFQCPSLRLVFQEKKNIFFWIVLVVVENIEYSQKFIHVQDWYCSLKVRERMTGLLLLLEFKTAVYSSIRLLFPHGSPGFSKVHWYLLFLRVSHSHLWYSFMPRTSRYDLFLIIYVLPRRRGIHL